MRRYALGEPRWSWGEPALTPPAALFCRINFLCHFFPGLFVHFDLHDLSAPRVSTSRKTPPEISKNTTTNCQTRSDCLILVIARSPFNVLSGITVACSSCRGPLPSGSGRPAISFPLLTSWQLMHYSWAPSTFWQGKPPARQLTDFYKSPSSQLMANCRPAVLIWTLHNSRWRSSPQENSRGLHAVPGSICLPVPICTSSA